MYVQVVEKHIPIAQETFPELTHPSCGGEGITITLYQLTRDSGFIYRATAKTSGEAVCVASGQSIPPMAWTDEMAAAFESLKARTKVDTETKVRLLGKILFGLLGLLLIAVPLGIFFASQGTDGYEQQRARIAAVTAAPSVGDWIETNGGDLGSPATHDASRKQWYIIRAMGPATVSVQAYESTFGTFEVDPFDPPDIDPARFSGATIEIDRSGFLQYERVNGQLASPFVVTNAVDADGTP